MNKYHQEILEEIKRHSKIAKPEMGGGRHFDLNRYMGTTRPIYLGMPTAQTRALAKNWVKTYSQLPLKDFIDFLDSLFAGQSHNERTFGGKVLEYAPKVRRQINPFSLDKWLTGAQGWLEVDSLCQSAFKAEELLNNWTAWEKLLKKFVIDKDIHKRRAALVLLTKPVGQSEDKRLSDLAFKNIDKLKTEKDVLITKATSWLLRSLIENHKERVKDYLKENQSTLPKIAVREVAKKLLTGKK